MTKVKLIFSSNSSCLKEALAPYKEICAVYDCNVEAFAKGIIPQGTPSLAITATEQNKTIEGAMAICRWLMSIGMDRKALLLCIGGGITSDMAGFAACIYKRGIRYANVPTTLLSMVDAGIGGKTGVNVDSLKNMIGVIRQPEFTFICPEPLNTLPRREFLSGAAEMLKTFLISSEQNYQDAVQALCNKEADIFGLIQKAASFKQEVVQQDENESGLRKILNFGHTYAHAIEWYQKQIDAPTQMTHGEAVAVGMIMAARLSEQKGIAKEGLAARLSEDFRNCGLPTECPFGIDVLDRALKQDKKAEGGITRFVLLKKVGKVVIE